MIETHGGLVRWYPTPHLTDDVMYAMPRQDQRIWITQRSPSPPSGVDMLGTVRGFGAYMAHNLACAYRPEGVNVC